MKLIIPFLLLLICSTCFADLLFSDDFNDGNADGWVTSGAAGFEVIENQYYIYFQGERGNGKTLNGDASGSMSTPDYSILCSILIQCGTEAGVIARYTGSDDWYYRMILRPNSSRIVLQRRKDSGVSLELQSVPYSLEHGISYRIRLEVSGDSIRGRIWQGSLEDEPEFWNLEDTDQYQSNPGSFGLFAAGVGKEKIPWSSSFDDVVVTTPFPEKLTQVTWASIKSAQN